MTLRRTPLLKFGGGSLADPDRVVALVAEAAPLSERPIVVVSARRGVTDLLRAAGRHPGSGRASTLVRHLVRQHPGLPAEADGALGRVERLVDRCARDGALSPVLEDELLSQGERLSAHWLAGRLLAAGHPATALEADRLGLITEGEPGQARIDLERSAPGVRAGLARSRASGEIPVVTGYFGRSRSGRVMTLGRGGSDYSATAIGAIVGARVVDLVKRNVAILTADPGLVPSARPVARLSYDEAEELAQFGGSVLHPAAIDPARRHAVVIRVRSLRDPEALTTIGIGRGGPGLRIVARLGPLGLVRVDLDGGGRRESLVARLTRSLGAARIHLAAVVTTEATLGILVDPEERHRAEALLQHDLGASAHSVHPPRLVSLVSVVGDDVLRELPRVPDWVLGRSLGLFGTRRALSFALPEAESVRGLRALHRTLVPRVPHPGFLETDELKPREEVGRFAPLAAGREGRES